MDKIYLEMVTDGSFVVDGCITTIDRFNFFKIDFFLNLSTELKSSVRKIYFIGDKSCAYNETAEEINLFNSNVIRVIKLFPNLCDLELSDFPALTDGHFAELGFEFLEKSERVCLRDNNLLTEITFGRIARTCRKLKSFSFTNNCSFERDVFIDVDQDDLLSLISGNNFLVVLNLKIKYISTLCLSELANRQGLESLSLDVHEWSKLSSKGISEILASSRVVYFSFCLFGVPIFEFLTFSTDSYMQRSSLLIKNDETDPLDFADLISVLKEHLKDVDILHLEDFPIMTDDVLKSIHENGSGNLKTIRFVNCDTNLSTQSKIQNMIDHCPLLTFLFLDGFDQGDSSVFKMNVHANSTLCVVYRNYRNDFTPKLVRKYIKQKLISEDNEEFLTDYPPERYRARIIDHNKVNDITVLGEKRDRDL
jgi:hypothetical protein